MQETPDSTEFLTLFPEFTDYGVPRIDAWLAVAQEMIIKCKWRQMFSYGCYLYTAHFIALELQNQNIVEQGGQSSSAGGALSGESKQIGDIRKSHTYNTNMSALPGQGQWAKTDYGQRLYQLIQMFGAPPLVS